MKPLAPNCRHIGTCAEADAAVAEFATRQGFSWRAALHNDAPAETRAPITGLLQAEVQRLTPGQAAERKVLETRTRDAVIAMARRRAHGEEIEAYLYEQAPLRVDPEQYIRQLLDEKVVFAHQCEPTTQQLVGIDPLWGRRVGHPFHHIFYAPPAEPRVFSASALELADDTVPERGGCRRAWAHRYIDKLKKPELSWEQCVAYQEWASANGYWRDPPPPLVKPVAGQRSASCGTRTHLYAQWYVTGAATADADVYGPRRLIDWESLPGQVLQSMLPLLPPAGSVAPENAECEFEIEIGGKPARPTGPADWLLSFDGPRNALKHHHTVWGIDLVREPSKQSGDAGLLLAGLRQLQELGVLTKLRYEPKMSEPALSPNMSMIWHNTEHAGPEWKWVFKRAANWRELMKQEPIAPVKFRGLIDILSNEAIEVWDHKTTRDIRAYALLPDVVAQALGAPERSLKNALQSCIYTLHRARQSDPPADAVTCRWTYGETDRSRRALPVVQDIPYAHALGVVERAANVARTLTYATSDEAPANTLACDKYGGCWYRGQPCKVRRDYGRIALQLEKEDTKMADKKPKSFAELQKEVAAAAAAKGAKPGAKNAGGNPGKVAAAPARPKFTPKKPVKAAPAPEPEETEEEQAEETEIPDEAPVAFFDVAALLEALHTDSDVRDAVKAIVRDSISIG